MENNNIEKELCSKFEQKFGHKPQILVRCPGRVNLIGEHIDYSGFSVLPMAIKQATYVLVRKNGTDKINFYNTDEKYESYMHDASVEWPGTTKPKWYHYFLSGWKGAQEQLKNLPSRSHGLDVLLSGNVPPNAGLSSSSSVVCAALLASLAADAKLNPENLDRNGIADLAARVERYIGVEGGGMDQAIECLASEGQALRIDFNPLLSTQVHLPKEALFAVIHSGATMNKGASSYYNERVVECRIAAQIVAKRQLHCNWREIRTLRHLSEFLGKTDFDDMIAVIDRHFDEEPMSRENVLRALETTDDDLIEYSLNNNTTEMKEFKLRQRAMHVFTEAQRVMDFQKACERNDLKEMGRLMNASHESCRNLFECSCPELDDVVEQCREVGCLGARLTGAGWGGCAVALVNSNDREKIGDKLDVLFWSEPSAGINLKYL
uniref:Galactokinase n=1 Tax=Panagrolaimus sp. PS1159 TaxID=55785 RepID=A0AC35FNE9_9BILA